MNLREVAGEGGQGFATDPFPSQEEPELEGSQTPGFHRLENLKHKTDLGDPP